ncbi:MAG: glycosyltransferase [Candidatus Magasanikbacteria bacterium]|nr:glycosyltransferase [Candidatus Magasanikbacteria bacterium]
MRIALVHDYLAQDGGAERVLWALHELYPEAPIFVLFHDREKITGFPEPNIRESFLARFPWIRSHFQWYLTLMPYATERHELRDFDVVISSASSFAKGVVTPPHSLHLSYCHTPTRWLWFDARQYLSDLPYNPLVKAVLPLLMHRLRTWDQLAANRVDHFIANSVTVQRRIWKYYRRESEVIYPPVDLSPYSAAEAPGEYFVAGGRLVPYKRLDLAVRVFNRLRWPLKIFGTGPELARLQEIAKPNVQFLGRITESAKAELLAGARAFIHPQLEDFGITPIEAMAAGRPVIAYAEGGATETVVPGITGLFFPRQSWESLLHAVLHFDTAIWNPARIRAHAEQFSTPIFKERLQRYVAERYEEFNRGLFQPVLLKSNQTMLPP